MLSSLKCRLSLWRHTALVCVLPCCICMAHSRQLGPAGESRRQTVQSDYSFSVRSAGRCVEPVHTYIPPLAPTRMHFRSRCVLALSLVVHCRQPFLTDVGSGEASVTPKYLEIRFNFLISNYGAGFGVDNDDTSSYYKIHHNFFYLGGGVKCDYDGHEKHFYNNVMLGTSAGCWHTCAYKKGFPDYCHDNKLVQVRHADSLSLSLPNHFAIPTY